MDNSDSALANGATNQNVFSNLTPEPEAEVINEEQLAQIRELIPNAQKEIEAINSEIASTDRLSDFIDSLRALPTDVAADTLQAKLESRFVYINYLIARRSLYEQALELAHITSEPLEIIPAPLIEPINLSALGESKEPASVPTLWQRIRTVFRK